MTHSSANAVAKAARSKEADNPVSTCPLMGGSVQLIPLRYGLCEVDEILPETVNGSLYQIEDVPLGMRPLNPGFIYALHSEKKDTLYCYAVAADGTLTGSTFILDGQVFNPSDNEMIFSRKGTLHVVFSPIAFTLDRAQILLIAKDDHKELMTEVDLEALSPLNGNKGFSPAATLSNVVDFTGSQAAPVIDSNIGSYQWLVDFNWQPDLSPTLLDTVKEDYEHNYGLLLLNDICGDIVEVAEKRSNLLTQYQQALEVTENGSNQVDKHEIAQLLNTLMSQEVGYQKIVDSVTSILKKPPETEDDKAVFAKDMQALAKAINNPDNIVMNQVTLPYGQQEVTIYNPVADKLANELGEKYQVKGTLLQETVETTADDHRELIEGGIFGKDGMKDVIKHDAMGEFITQWDEREQTFGEHLAPLNDFMQLLAPKWHLLAAYQSPIEADNLALKLDYEDILVSFFKGNDDAWLQEYYYGQDTFPLMVYSDTASNLYADSLTLNALKKDVASIRNKFIGLKDKLKGVKDWQDKMQKANDVKLLGSISNEDIKARAIQSLGLKNELWVAALSMQEVGHVSNFSERLGQSFDNMSQGLKTQLHLSFEAHDLHWNVPELAVMQKIDQLSQQLSDNIQSDRELRQKKIKHKKQSINITKTASKGERKRLRQQYNQNLAKLNQTITANASQIIQVQNTLLKHTIDGGSLVAGSSIAAINQRLLNEAAAITKNWNVKEIAKELTQKEGKIDNAKLEKLGINVMLTSLYCYSFYTAITDYLDEEKDGDLLNVITSGSFALSGSLTLASSLYNAKLNIALTVHTTTQASTTLAKIATWSVYSSPISAWLGVWGMGVRTYKAGQDWIHSWTQSTTQQGLSVVRAGVSLGGAMAATGEAVAYTIHAIKLWRGAEALVINEALAASAARFIRWNVGFFIAFYVIEKLYQYYKWPELVDWAYKSLWGNKSQGWNIEQHYQQLDPLMGQPALRAEVINNTYTAKETGCAEVQLHLLLPNISQPSQENIKLAFMGFSRAVQGHEAKWHDLLPMMLETAEVKPLAGNRCQLSVHIDSDSLYALGVMETQLAVQLTTEAGVTQYSWDINCQRVSFGVQENPNVMNVRHWKREVFPAHSLTPWPAPV